MAELLYPDIAGNYLSGLRDAQEREVKAQQAQRAQTVASQQDTLFAQGQQDRVQQEQAQQINNLGAILRNVKSPADFPGAQQAAVRLGIPADVVGKYTYADVPNLIALSDRAQAALAAQQKQNLEGAQIAAAHAKLSVQLVDDAGQLVSVVKADIATFEPAKVSPMPPATTALNPDEIADVVGYLLSLRGVQ